MATKNASELNAIRQEVEGLKERMTGGVNPEYAGVVLNQEAIDKTLAAAHIAAILGGDDEEEVQDPDSGNSSISLRVPSSPTTPKNRSRSPSPSPRAYQNITEVPVSQIYERLSKATEGLSINLPQMDRPLTPREVHAITGLWADAPLSPTTHHSSSPKRQSTHSRRASIEGGYISSEEDEDSELAEQAREYIREVKNVREQATEHFDAINPPDLKDLSVWVHGDYTQFLQHLSKTGVTLSAQEEGPIKRKFQATGGITVRDAIMYLEGFRSRSNISESRVSEQVNKTEQVLESFKAQVRVMSTVISEVKEQERRYTQLLEEAIIQSQRSKEDTVRAHDEQEISSQPKESEAPPVVLGRTHQAKGTHKRSSETKRTKPPSLFASTTPIVLSQAPRHDPFVASLPDTSPSTPSIMHALDAAHHKEMEKIVPPSLLAVAEYLKMPVTSLAGVYGMGVRDWVNKIGEFPTLIEDAISVYGSLKKVYLEIHRRLKAAQT